MAVTLRIRITPKRVVAVLLASLVAALLVVAAMSLLGEYTKTRGRLLLTALSLAGFCLLAVAPSALAQRPKHPFFGAAGLAASCLGYLLVAVGTWATPNSDAYWKATAILSIVAVSLSHLCWLLLLAPSPDSSGLARVTWWAATRAAGLVPVLAGFAITVEIKAAPFWWVVAIIIIVQIAGGFAARILTRRGPRGKVQDEENTL